MKPRPKKQIKETAKQRIKELFQEAQKTKSQKLANRYVQLARKIAGKARIRMPKIYKRRFCKHCYTYLRSGQNARIRTRQGKLVIYCLECKKFARIPLR
ncbi:MAG: ribonuclease P [Nanoarchaeota archaeon]|nr:ribonuclease P [Nanoarchaeota archaeon]